MVFILVTDLDDACVGSENHRDHKSLKNLLWGGKCLGTNHSDFGGNPVSDLDLGFFLI